MNASLDSAAGAPAPLSLARQNRAIGLIGAGHFNSHLYGLVLPPLFPFMKADLGVSYAALGLLMSLYFVASATVQIPVGILVDRIGARVVLFAGLLVMGTGVTLAGLVGEYWAMAGLFLCAGMGNSVFHPADFVILSASVEKGRLGRAFGFHSFCGSAGTALAPVTMLVLASQFGWRSALVTVGLFGLAITAILFASRTALREDAMRKQREKTDGGGFGATRRVLFSRTILSFFLFYVASASAHSAINSFSVVVLSQQYGAPLALANGVLSAFLIAAVIGVVLGGFLADRTDRHDRILVATFAVSALCIGGVATGALPLWLIAAAITLAGLMRGIVSPSRDLMVREAAPGGLLGTVMAFVTFGFTIGSSSMPVICGWLVDLGYGDAIFWLSATMMLLVIGSVFIARERSL